VFYTKATPVPRWLPYLIPFLAKFQYAGWMKLPPPYFYVEDDTLTPLMLARDGVSTRGR
jgi:hypothetical protein